MSDNATLVILAVVSNLSALAVWLGPDVIRLLRDRHRRRE